MCTIYIYIRFVESSKKQEIRLSHVVLPGAPYESSENLGIIIYREGTLTYDQTLDHIMHKINIANIVTHAIAHQMCTLINPHEWSYSWLNHGISTLLTFRIINQIYPKSDIWHFFAVQIQQESLRFNTDYTLIMQSAISEKVDLNSLTEINSVSFPFFYYLKGPALLLMLLRQVTEDVFWNGIETFLKRKIPNLKNFWIAMQDAQDETQFVNNKIKDLMESWILLRHYPIVEVHTHNSSHVQIFSQIDSFRYLRIKWTIIQGKIRDNDIEYFKTTDVKMFNKSEELYINCEKDLMTQILILNYRQEESKGDIY